MADTKSTVSTNNGPKAKMPWWNRLIVEPLAIAFMFSYGALITIRVEYVNKRLSEEADFNESASNTSLQCALNTSSDEYAQYVEVQTQTSYWSLYLAVAQSLPALFSANIIGAVSDTKGRRLAMFIPIIGFGVYAIVYALVAQYHLPLYVMVLGSISLGICGDFLTLVACAFAYVADTTTPEQRTYRMVILECMAFVSAGIGQLGAGFMIPATGYPAVYYVILGLMVTCLGYLYFLPESLPKLSSYKSDSISDLRVTPARSLNVKVFFRNIADLFRPDPKGRCWKMISYNIILFHVILIITAFLSTNVLFIEGQPFCWNSVLIGIFNGLAFVLGGIGLVVGGYVLRLFVSDHFTMQISILSFVSCLLLTAFATSNAALFSVTLVGSLRMLSMPICRAKMSNLIGPDEQGKLFACSGCIQSVGTLLSPVIFSALYPLTLNVSPGFSFVVMAMTFIFPFLLTLALQIDDYRRSHAPFVSLQTI